MCSTGQQFNTNVALNGLKINGDSVTNLAVASQSGSPYMSSSVAISGNPVVSIISPNCSGEWCSWAQLAAGSEVSFTVQATKSGRIDSFTLDSITLDGNSPIPTPSVEPSPTPSVSPSPQPIVEATGRMDLTIDAVKLVNDCQTTACNLKVKIVSPANIVVDEEQINPTENPKLGVTLENLLVGSYTIVVEENSLPTLSNKKVIYSYVPSATVAIADKSTVSEKVVFDTAIISHTYNLALNLSGISDSKLANKVVYGQLINKNGAVVQTFSTTPTGIVNLTTTESGGYTVKIQGLGNPISGVYYSSIEKTVNISDQNTSLPMTYNKIASSNLFAVNLSVTNPSEQQTLKFGADSSLFVYESTIAKTGVLYFSKNESTVALTASKISGYTTVTNPSPLVVNSSGDISIVNQTTVTPDVQANKVVTVYLLIDKMSTLEQYINDLNSISRPNFNRVIFSFVRPTLTNYTSGSLANTGILGYWDSGDGNGVVAFDKLKEAAKLSASKNIQPFISVGGWNYSCNFEEYGNKCGDTPTATNGVHYDYFPDPTEVSEATVAAKSYANIIRLTNDLGMQGIDFDAEEFWHADKYAVAWKPGASGEWSTQIGKDILAAGGPTYTNLMKYGAATTGGTPAVMPKTIDKVAAILHALEDNPNAKDLMFSTAAPPVGARPTTGFVYGDNGTDIYTKGGVWWLGNLKGLWYHLADKDKAVVNRFDSLGLMTYDLCGDNATVCAPYGGGPIDLPGQVAAYMKDYTTWLKTEKAADLSVSDTGKVTFYPAHYSVNSKIQFGFEVNKPAYPRNDAGILQLTDSLVDTILSQQKDAGGVIIWQMYSVQNVAGNGTTSKYTMNQSCKTFLSNDNRYDCNANFPSEVK